MDERGSGAGCGLEGKPGAVDGHVDVLHRILQQPVDADERPQVEDDVDAAGRLQEGTAVAHVGLDPHRLAIEVGFLDIEDPDSRAGANETLDQVTTHEPGSPGHQCGSSHVSLFGEARDRDPFHPALGP